MKKSIPSYGIGDQIRNVSINKPYNSLSLKFVIISGIMGGRVSEEKKFTLCRVIIIHHLKIIFLKDSAKCFMLCSSTNRRNASSPTN